ncbi:hypothetical protein LSH36_122g04004 [Paralvinella palmiformis]|uniref:Uncharacterized protein n=1 Tax=Paralvinella palmiformis TaxID=53620 RepID=A0AAD9JXU8_9ANNE|nr:hypothetical protein LSH36_122g04004 [Paralvinella palmiformis]
MITIPILLENWSLTNQRCSGYPLRYAHLTPQPPGKVCYLAISD